MPLRSRIIPCLLLKDSGLVKSIQFKDYKYIGDPLNAVRIFNEKKADELILLDIEASARNRRPNFKLIEKIASECRMPLCYGGGIKTTEDALNVLSLGVEKISISSSIFENPGLINKISEKTGSQSLSVVIDYKKPLLATQPQVYINNGQKRIKENIFDIIKKIQDEGAGEIILNSIDLDGTQKGLDIEFLKNVKDISSIPFTVMGGASSLDDVKKASQNLGPCGIGVGSLFVFKGRLRAVLINYPGKDSLVEMLKS